VTHQDTAEVLKFHALGSKREDGWGELRADRLESIDLAGRPWTAARARLEGSKARQNLRRVLDESVTENHAREFSESAKRNVIPTT
jgi:hypothetical protein